MQGRPEIVANREEISVQVRQVGRWTYEIVILAKNLVVNRDRWGLPVRYGRRRAERYARRALADYLKRYDRPKVVAEFRPE